jgi:hypothetical protein
MLARPATPVIVYGHPTITATKGGSEVRADVLANDVLPAGATLTITSQPSLGSARVDSQTQETVYAPRPPALAWRQSVMSFLRAP